MLGFGFLEREALKNKQKDDEQVRKVQGFIAKTPKKCSRKFILG